MFCICCWIFDDSDHEKDKGLFVVCCSVCEKWFHQKMCENKKRNAFGRASPQKMEMSFMLYRLSDTYMTITINM